MIFDIMVRLAAAWTHEIQQPCPQEHIHTGSEPGTGDLELMNHTVRNEVTDIYRICHGQPYPLMLYSP